MLIPIGLLTEGRWSLEEMEVDDEVDRLDVRFVGHSRKH